MKKEIRDPNGNRHVVKIDKDLAFLAPYLTVARKMGLPVWRVRRIKGYSVPSDKTERQYAAMLKDSQSPNKKVTITILKWLQSDTRVSGYEAADDPGRIEHTLNCFAHELTHLVHWDHGPDRFILEKRLQKSFAYLAKKRGYEGYRG